MSEQKAANQSPVHLSAADLETMLGVLSAEEGAVRTDRGRLVSNLVSYMAFGVVLFACPIGLLVVWSDKALGLGLLLAAAVAMLLFVLFFMRSEGTLLEFASLSETDVRAAQSAWTKRSRGLLGTIGFLLIPGLVAILGGFGWFVYDLFAQEEVNLASMALMAVPLLGFMVFVAVSQYRQYQYLSRVSELRGQLVSQLQKVSTEGLEQAPVSPAELDLYAQVETMQVARKVAQATEQLPVQEWYSVAIGPGPLGFMKGLEGEARAAIREAIDALQYDPRPEGAEPVSGDENALTIPSGDYQITYVVDGAKRRVDVIAIRDARAGEVPDGA